MAMTTTETFDHLSGKYLVSVVPGTGQVEIQVQHDATTWVTSDTITEEGVFEVNFGRAVVRIAPSGGASYEVHQ